MHGDLSFGVTLVVLKCNHFQLRDLNPREQFFEDVTRHACDDWDLKYSEMDSFASLSYDQQLSHVESSPCFAVLTPLPSVVGSLSDGILFSIIFHGAVGIISYHSNTTSLVLYQIYKGAWNYAYNKVRNLSYGDMMGLGREELGFGSRVLSGQGVQKCPDGSGREESRKHQEDALWIRLVNVTKRRSQSDEDKAARAKSTRDLEVYLGANGRVCKDRARQYGRVRIVRILRTKTDIPGKLLQCLGVIRTCPDGSGREESRKHQEDALWIRLVNVSKRRSQSDEDKAARYLITEDTQQKHTTSSHFTSLHPQLHHHRSSFTDNFTDLKADHKTKERRERSLPALILRAPQLVTYSTGEPRNPHNSRLIKDLTHG
ncbi:hypothetical protein DY000_02008138 [Brassica cretica]|uniref:Uncharacterized protein n=1 Tax=Brassica cretica TaxID=69181 RepID=A0ABQ7BY90_BRACR|nr:hypothetical protein DY000_02008138 [Brassica cretica]